MSAAAKKDEGKGKDAKKEETPTDPAQVAAADLDAALSLIGRGVAQNEARFVHRAVSKIVKMRRHLSADALKAAIAKQFADDNTTGAALVAYLSGEAPMETGAAVAAAAATSGFEAELYLHMLTIINLIDASKPAEAVACSKALVDKLRAVKHRASIGDEIAAKAYFYFARAHELHGASRSIRGDLHAALRTATLRADEPAQAVLMNALLRNYLEDNLVDQAQRLVSKTVWPESAGNSEASRFLYYLGRIKAIQLDYSEANTNLELAIRKAPKGAVGFLQVANKLGVIVQMLLGEIPDRDIFRQKDLRRSLAPYFKLTQAVRVGNLSKFNAVVKEHEAIFTRDKNYTLILRLRHNVIKTAVRMVNVSYSRLSLGDVATKLGLDSAEDAEYIVAKAVRDGVVDATINHQDKFVTSNEVTDIYSSTEPHDAFHQRISFCLSLHNDLVKSMRYPPNAYRRYLEDPEQRKNREDEASEIVASMEEEEDDF